jgi:hypothetical protein
MADEEEEFLTVSGGTVVRLGDTIGLVFDVPGGDRLKLVLPRDGVNPFVAALEKTLHELNGEKPPPRMHVGPPPKKPQDYN